MVASVDDPVGATVASLVGLTGAVLVGADVALEPPEVPDGPTPVPDGPVDVGCTLVPVGPTGETLVPVGPTGETLDGETAPPVPEVDAVVELEVEAEPEGAVVIWSIESPSPVEQATTKHPSQKLWEEGRRLIIVAFEFP